MFETFFYIYFWNCLYNNKYYKYNLNHRLTKNDIGLYHAVVIFLLTQLFLFTDDYRLQHDIYYVSQSYFLFDAYKIARNMKYSITNIVLILHHLIAIYSLQWVFYNTWCYGIIYIISLTELSNIPGYYSYYFKKTKKTINQKHITNAMIISQTIIYSFIRVILLPHSLTYYNIYIYPKEFMVLGTLLYIMGLVWSFKLCKQSIIIIKSYL